MGHLDRDTRRALEERAKRVRLQGQLEGWSRERVVDEILARVPGMSALEAHRLAWGWTRQQLSQALDALYRADGLMPPGIGVSEICRWEHGRHRPNPERQEYLTRLYRTRPDRLGFGRDHSPEAASEPTSEGEAGGVPLGVLGWPLGISAGQGDRIVAMRWAPDGEGGTELVVELEDGDGDGRSRLRLSGWRALPGEAG
jgi:hypothetical protein